MNQPIDHPRAKSFSFKEVLGVDQKPYLVLEVGTDLRGHDLTETEAGRSLAAAVSVYIESDGCRAKEVKIICLGGQNA